MIRGINPTQQFALASVYPRSIAWLVKQDDWSSFEEIVNYNCAMLGGYFNVIIPINSNGEISEKYLRFMVDYDPDLIILAPGISSIQNDSLLKLVHPFAIIPWDSVSQIATLDPMGFGSCLNLTLKDLDIESSKKPVIAVADDAYPDTSRLAFVACGDIKKSTKQNDPLAKLTMRFDHSSRGYREQILGKFLKPEYDPKDFNYQIRKGVFIPSPDRHKLKNMITEEYQFPIYTSTEILHTCCRMQNLFNSQYWSFIGSTATYAKGTAPHRLPYNMVILVSNKFSLEEATLFWNLRAQEVYVTWLSFSELERDKKSVKKWLSDIFGGALYVDQARFIPAGVNLVFSSPDRDIDRLKPIFDYLEKARRKDSSWKIVCYDDLIFYSYIRPQISQDRIMMAQDASICAFLPKLLPGIFGGILVVLLEWDGLMLPQIDTLTTLISAEKIQEHDANGEQKIDMPKFRIAKNHFLEVQVNDKAEIVFRKPSTERIFEAIFFSAGFSKVEPSDKAGYQVDFIEKCSSDLNKAARYFAASPFREFFEFMSNNKNRQKLGWILKYPDRRALNHLQLMEIFKEQIPGTTSDYFNTISDKLPNGAVELLEKRLLERGFELKCEACSYKSWYPAEDLGQVFKCNQCHQSQVCIANPLWLYKLPEVTFKVFSNNLEVPLLALNYLKNKSKHYFIWVPDLDIWYGNEKKSRNIDIACIIDGRLFLGEAKSIDKIEKGQIKFYKDLCELISPDGIVFATSKTKWNQSTIDCIDSLKRNFDGETIILTYKDLYSF